MKEKVPEIKNTYLYTDVQPYMLRHTNTPVQPPPPPKKKQEENYTHWKQKKQR